MATNSGGNFRRQECQDQYEYYHSKFPSIPTMTSEDLIERRRRQQEQHKSKHPQGGKGSSKYNNDKNNILLIDVRTKPEREVSMIPGAVTLSQFYEQEKQQKPSFINSNDTIVVTYCTIGFRSGLEARRLLDQYPELDGRIFNLDGILMYSHVGKLATLDQSNVMEEDDPQQQQPQQQIEAANQVHTFSKTWQSCANEENYTPVFYGFPSVLGRLIQVGTLLAVRGSQRISYLCTRSCSCLLFWGTTIRREQSGNLEKRH